MRVRPNDDHSRCSPMPTKRVRRYCMPWLLQNVCKLRRPLYMATVVFLHRQSFLSQTLGTDGVIIPAVAVMTQASSETVTPFSHSLAGTTFCRRIIENRRTYVAALICPKSQSQSIALSRNCCGVRHIREHRCEVSGTITA